MINRSEHDERRFQLGRSVYLIEQLIKLLTDAQPDLDNQILKRAATFAAAHQSAWDYYAIERLVELNSQLIADGYDPIEFDLKDYN